MDRTSGVARRKAGFYDPLSVKARTPFKGDDPFSKTFRSLWDIPGTIAQGFSNIATGKRKITEEEWSGVLATAALSAAGIYAGTRTTRTAPRTPGARPMTTAERSAAVTRAGRTGVGYIGQGNFRSLQGSSYMGKSRYDLVFDEATRISQSRRPSPAFSGAPAYLRRSGVSPETAAQMQQALYERQSQWAMIGGKLRNVDRVYEGARDYRAAGPRRRNVGKNIKKGPKKK
jgi:hypothetical protein